jgi:hypothetical protein
VQWDREKAVNRQKMQEELLREYVLHHVYPYSPFYRRRFDGAKLSPKNITGVADLAKLEPTGWNEVETEPGAFVLRPTERAIARFGDRRLVMAITKAKLRGKVAELNRDLIDPAYKPIHWHLEGDVPLGYSGEDLQRLGEAGRRVLQLAGVSRDDVLVGLAAPGPSLSYWQLVEGARQAGVSAVHLGAGAPRERIEAAAPTVLAGEAGALQAALDAVNSAKRRLAGLRTILVLGDALDESTRDALRAQGRKVGEGDLEVVSAWAPPGVRALWAECRGGRGYHTYPDLEWLETLPDGEVAWTSLTWHGSAFLRLRTDVRATIDDSGCPTCGRVGPRLVTGAVAPSAAPRRAAPARPPAAVAPRGKEEAGEEAELEPAAAGGAVAPPKVWDLKVLDEHPAVAAWAVELRRVNGVEELIVFVSPAGIDRLGPLFRELDSTLSATQYVVERPEQVRARVDRNGAVLDLR